MMAAALMAASANYAQNVATGETNSASSNWFVRVGAGGLIYFGEPGGRSGEGVLSVSVGLTYKIPSR